MSSKQKGIYIESVTAEIFVALIDIINPNIKDKIFLDAQEKVRKIIAREYVEIEQQIKDEPKQINPVGRPRVLVV